MKSTGSASPAAVYQDSCRRPFRSPLAHPRSRSSHAPLTGAATPESPAKPPPDGALDAAADAISRRACFRSALDMCPGSSFAIVRS